MYLYIVATTFQIVYAPEFQPDDAKPALDVDVGLFRCSFPLAQRLVGRSQEYRVRVGGEEEIQRIQAEAVECPALVRRYEDHTDGVAQQAAEGSHRSDVFVNATKQQLHLLPMAGCQHVGRRGVHRRQTQERSLPDEACQAFPDVFPGVEDSTFHYFNHAVQVIRARRPMGRLSA